MKNKTISFRTKLLLYFLLFAAIIFALLWILQTVFLQHFYNRMLADNARSAAEEIAEHSREDDLENLIDSLASEHSLLVFITDTEGNILYSSDSYKSYYSRGDDGGSGEDYGSGEEENPYRRGDDSIWQSAGYRYLPDGYSDFIAELEASGSDTVEINSDSQYIYGMKIHMEQSGDAVLYVSVSYGAVGATAGIIRLQLLWVTLLSLVIAFIIAFLIARKFAKPVGALTERAESLGDGSSNNGSADKGNADQASSIGFCRELDELGNVMEATDRKLEEASRYQKELLANVSHDLRTPLTMIRGYAEMVRDISWDNEEQREADIAVIIDETERLSALVNEILEYSKLAEKGGADTEFTGVDLGALAAKTADRFEPLFRREGGIIERNIEEGCIVCGNEELLERAVYNLIDNAIRHSKESRKITVNVRGKAPSVLEVRDYGTGIDESELPHIWEKYYTSRMRSGQGVSGLGLAIVKQIAEVHGGSCSAQNNAGGGSTFRLEL